MLFDSYSNKPLVHLDKILQIFENDEITVLSVNYGKISVYKYNENYVFTSTGRLIIEELSMLSLDSKNIRQLLQIISKIGISVFIIPDIISVLIGLHKFTFEFNEVIFHKLIRSLNKLCYDEVFDGIYELCNINDEPIYSINEFIISKILRGELIKHIDNNSNIWFIDSEWRINDIKQLNINLRDMLYIWFGDIFIVIDKLELYILIVKNVKDFSKLKHFFNITKNNKWVNKLFEEDVEHMNYKYYDIDELVDEIIRIQMEQIDEKL